MNFVKTQWTESVQRLDPSFSPVYPPSEDFQIGDVYAVRQNCGADERDKEEKALTLRLGSARGAYPKLMEIYRHRYRLPDSARDSSTQAIDLKKDQGRWNDRDPVFDGRKSYATALPIAAFPNYSIAAGNAWNFSGSLMGSAFGAIFGASGIKDTKVRMTLTGNSTFGLPYFEAESLLTNYCTTTGHCTEMALRQAFASTYGKSENERCAISVKMLSRLVVTRGINYEFITTDAVATRLVAARIKTMKLFAEKAKALNAPAAPAANNPAPALPPAGTAADSDVSRQVENARKDLLNTLLDQVNNDVDSLAGSDGPGFAGSFGQYSAGGLMLSEQFARPLVFAYGGVNRTVSGNELAPANSADRRDVVAPYGLASKKVPTDVQPGTPAGPSPQPPITNTTLGILSVPSNVCILKGTTVEDQAEFDRCTRLNAAVK